ncbi:MAG: hypothetical protein KF685_01485 [Acidobacteria bacterium]|nr:hypothetical protein [Acidobacteriota bacterium]
MKRTFLAVFALIFVFTVNGFAQKPADDKKAVLDIVNKLFDEMAAANAAGIIETGTPENQLVAIQKMRDGKSRISVIGNEAFSKFFTKPGGIEEVMPDPKVEVDGDWAMVWGRYVFWAEGKLSHCGINQFNLVRTDAGWKIANGASTMDPGGCTEKEKALKPSPKK